MKLFIFARQIFRPAKAIGLPAAKTARKSTTLRGNVVNVDSVRRMLERLEQINEQPLESLRFVRDDGTEIPVSREEIEDWRFIGMSNKAFIEFHVLGRA